MRKFIIADIHGRHDLFTKLIDDVLPNQANLDLTQDKLVLTGDYVDRGPDSRGVIARLIALQEFYGENVVCLFGNHERMMVDAVAQLENNGARTHADEDYLYLWLMNGGGETLRSYGAIEPASAGYKVGLTEELIAHTKWLSKLPLSHEMPGFFFSHAPAPRENRRPINRRGQPFTEEELTWTYSDDEFGVARNFGNGVVGVCGHIHRLREGIREPRFYDHYIFADAGCGCHKEAPLVAINVETREVFYARPKPWFLEET